MCLQKSITQSLKQLSCSSAPQSRMKTGDLETPNFPTLRIWAPPRLIHSFQNFSQSKLQAYTLLSFHGL